MLGYILLMALCGMLFIAALGAAVYGFIKKRRTLAFSSVGAAALLTLAGIALAYTYVKKSIAYVASDEFQKETRDKAKGVGKTWGSTVSGVSEGLSSTLDDEAIARLANKSAVITGKVIKASSAGLDSTIRKTSITTDKSVQDAGLVVGRAEENIRSGRNIGLFIDFNRAFSGKLKLTAYDAQGAKMDVSEVSLKEDAGTGHMVVFDYQYLTPGLSGYCILVAMPGK